MAAALSARHHLLGLFILWHLAAVAAPMLPDVAIISTVSDVTAPYRKHLGVRQGWSMFSKVPAETGRLEIHVEEAGQWRPLFIERSAEADWSAAMFEQYRWREAIRETLFTKKERRNRARLWRWIAGHVFAELPEVDAVRFDAVVVKTPAPQQYSQTGEMIRRSVKRTETIRRSDL